MLFSDKTGDSCSESLWAVKLDVVSSIGHPEYRATADSASNLSGHVALRGSKLVGILQFLR